MSWTALLAVIREEAGADLADRIEVRARELAGIRVTVPASDRPPLTDVEIDRALRASGYHIGKAAEALGVAPSSLYRHLNRKLRPKPPPAPPPRLIR